jgi:hypothetical protein
MWRYHCAENELLGYLTASSQVLSSRIPYASLVRRRCGIGVVKCVGRTPFVHQRLPLAHQSYISGVPVTCLLLRTRPESFRIADTVHCSSNYAPSPRPVDVRLFRRTRLHGYLSYPYQNGYLQYHSSDSAYLCRPTRFIMGRFRKFTIAIQCCSRWLISINCTPIRSWTVAPSCICETQEC